MKWLFYCVQHESCLTVLYCGDVTSESQLMYPCLYIDMLYYLMYCTHYIPSVLICICTINKDYSRRCYIKSDCCQKRTHKIKVKKKCVHTREKSFTNRDKPWCINRPVMDFERRNLQDYLT